MLFPRLVRLLPLAACIVLAGTSLHAQSHDKGFREFPRELVPAPDQLLRQLTVAGFFARDSIEGTPFDELQKRGMEMLAELSPEQRKNLTELAENYLRERGVDPSRPHGEWSELAREFQQQVGDDPKLADTIEDFRRQFSELEQQQRNGQSPDRQTSDQPARTGGASTPRSPNSEPEEPPSRSGYRWREPSGEPATRGGKSESPAQQADAENARGNALPESTRGDSPTPRNGTPARGDRRLRDERRGTRGDGDDAPGEERIGVRFDRLLMDAAARGLESGDAGQQSRLADSVNSVLGHLARHVNSVVQQHARTSAERGESRGTPRRLRSLVNTSALNQMWSRLNRLEPARGAATTVPFGTPVFTIVLCLFLITGAWLVVRFLYRPLRMAKKSHDSNATHWRYSVAGSPGELIAAVDGLLLARFGRSASWWDVRRAETKLRESEFRRVSDSRIGDLASAYEEARYSGGARHWTADRLERLNETLRELTGDLDCEHVSR